MSQPPLLTLTDIINAALREDMPDGDVTTNLMVSLPSVTSARLISKEAGIFYGAEVIDEVCRIVDSQIEITHHIGNGSPVQKDDVITEFKGLDSSLLIAERVMLNFAQRLSGIATRTRSFVDRLDSPTIHVLDTRKTTPLFRFLERRAVVAGGGFNHRLNLSEMVLIKENHLSSFLSKNQVSRLPVMFSSFKAFFPEIPIEIEIETLDQLRQFELSRVDCILLDNFSLEDIPTAVQICKDRGFRAQIEVSGNVTLETIALYRDLPIQRISVGALTHSVPALDLSLLFG